MDKMAMATASNQAAEAVNRVGSTKSSNQSHQATENKDKSQKQEG